MTKRRVVWLVGIALAAVVLIAVVLLLFNDVGSVSGH